MEIIWARFPAQRSGARTTRPGARSTKRKSSRPSGASCANNGFRAGVIGGTPARRDRQRAATWRSRRADDGESRPAMQSLELDSPRPIVHGTSAQLRRDQRIGNPGVGESMPSLPLLGERRPRAGRPHLPRGTGDLRAASRSATGSDRAVVELTPELHYGPSQLRWTGGEDGMDVVLGSCRCASARCSSRLRMDVRLAPGEMLVLDEPARCRQPLGPLLPHGRFGRRPRAEARFSFAWPRCRRATRSPNWSSNNVLRVVDGRIQIDRRLGRRLQSLPPDGPSPLWPKTARISGSAATGTPAGRRSIDPRR